MQELSNEEQAKEAPRAESGRRLTEIDLSLVPFLALNDCPFYLVLLWAMSLSKPETTPTPTPASEE